ncbi:type II toxin-antitoxin system VapC family toxin [Sphingopyxis sp. DHUNG17]|uniref:type II toxin-antitoxin system VapC family toxin n=1 Tax=Sphingopyxis jiangsuensis TaxID=2871171 RepID=UPI00191DB470|nr:type II toxin-antitoxin system VapC family toxin [Sphingopyxis lutea]MBL0770081.1 type II toxin-antitoxin system VapC family toxin [Sphingopyxis lutea]
MILLDTNILSEVLRTAPEPRVLDWMGQQAASSLFVTTVTQAEILYGIAILDKGRRRDELAAAALLMFAEDFAGRLLAFDGDAATAFAEIAPARRSMGRPISQFDAQIAAIARSRGAVLATRNSRDFERCGIEIVDPWSS